MWGPKKRQGETMNVVNDVLGHCVPGRSDRTSFRSFQRCVVTSIPI